MGMDQQPQAALALMAKSIPFTLFTHTGPISSLDEAASERGQIPEQIVRSILFRIGEGLFCMVLIAGPGQISWPRLRAYLGLSRLSLASESEVLAQTGYRVGAVTPMGLPYPIRVLADKNVFAQKEISIGSGQRSTAIIMKSSDLLKSIDNIEIDVFSEINPDRP